MLNNWLHTNLLKSCRFQYVKNNNVTFHISQSFSCFYVQRIGLPYILEKRDCPRFDWCRKCPIWLGTNSREEQVEIPESEYSAGGAESTEPSFLPHAPPSLTSPSWKHPHLSSLFLATWKTQSPAGLPSGSKRWCGGRGSKVWIQPPLPTVVFLLPLGGHAV